MPRGGGGGGGGGGGERAITQIKCMIFLLLGSLFFTFNGCHPSDFEKPPPSPPGEDCKFGNLKFSAFGQT